VKVNVHLVFLLKLYGNNGQLNTFVSLRSDFWIKYDLIEFLGILGPEFSYFYQLFF
jgi:hypothetical protein